MSLPARRDHAGTYRQALRSERHGSFADDASGGETDGDRGRLDHQYWFDRRSDAGAASLCVQRKQSCGRCDYSLSFSGAWPAQDSRELARSGDGGNGRIARFRAAQGSFREEMERQTPLRRIAQPEDIALAATFLASDDARWITGQVIVRGRRM